MKKRLVVLTGAGISAESGIPTFRASDGLWEGHDVTEVASPQGWYKNRELVLDFYNQRRKNASEVDPNRGHEILAELENDFEVDIITQNIDNLHERAGSSKVLHLHGEIFKSRSTLDPSLVYDIDGWQLNLGDNCEKGSQLRPHIVWFGEAVPNMAIADRIVMKADLFLVVGTSMVVYPAAGLIHQTRIGIPKFMVDPKIPFMGNIDNFTAIEEKASTGMEKLRDLLLEKHL